MLPLKFQIQAVKIRKFRNTIYLQVVGGVPARVEEHDVVGRRQVDPDAARPGRDQKDARLVVRVEPLHLGGTDRQIQSQVDFVSNSVSS